MERLPLIFANLLAQLKRPIPDVPVSAELPTAGHSSNSLAAALGDPPSNIMPSTAMEQTDVVAQPSEDDAVMQSGTSDVLPEAHLPQSRDPAPTPDSQTQTVGNTPSVSVQPSSSSDITLVNPPYPTTANQHITTVPDDAVHQGYKPAGYNQLALIPRSKFSHSIPNVIQGKVHQPQLPGWYQPEASTSTLPRQPPVKVRLPREADRSRLAKDILKQLGKPSGFVPAVLTRHEYEERKKTGAQMEATSALPPTEPVVAEPQLSSNHDDPSLPPEIDIVPDQVPPLGLPVNPPPVTQANESPLLEYPDPETGSTTQDAEVTGEDVSMDIQPPEGLLAPQPPTSPRSDPPQEPVPSPVIPESALDEEGSAANRPAVSELPSVKRSGPPPGAEVIEISDDEEPTTVDAVTNAIEPMEVDVEVGTGGAISQSLSGLSLDGDDTLITVETEKDRTKEPLNRRPSQETIDSEDIRPTERKLKRKFCVEVPPLPEYARRKKGKERASIQEDEEGLCGVSVLRAWLLMYYSHPRPRTSSCRQPGIFKIATDALSVVGMQGYPQLCGQLGQIC